jgi:O-Antigen ligase
MTAGVQRPPVSATDRARRLTVSRAYLALPAAFTTGLALRAGGFFPATAGVLCVLLVLLLVLRVTVAQHPFAGWSQALAVSAGALALLTAWTLVSGTWSQSPIRAMIEFDRSLAYTLMLCLIGSFAARPGDLDRTLRLVALAIGGLVAIALVTRLDPARFPTDGGLARARLAFPLTYWNALGVFCAVGLTLALHATASPGQGRVTRILAAGAIPAMAVTLYFTFSRGGIAVAAVGLITYAVLSHSLRLPIAVLAVALPTVVAVRAAYAADGLATSQYASATAEAGHVAAVVGACVVAAMVFRALGLLADARVDRIQISARARRVARGSAVALVVAGLLVGGAVTDLPQRIDDQRRAFLRPGPLAVGPDQRQRLTEFGANGRIESWRVARRAFEREPLTGTGAGTFSLEWERRRDVDMKVVDAHSLYLEILGELGIPGLVLLAIGLLVPLAVAARRLAGPEGHAHAAFIAAGLVLLVHAAVDWDWEMPALFGWYIATAGVVCAARVSARNQVQPRRLTRLISGLGCLVLAITPATVALSQARLDGATSAFKAGDCDAAVTGALQSLDVLSRPEPFELLGYCDVRAGQRGLAVRAMQAARDRDPKAWQYAYGLSVAQALSGGDPRPMARIALQLNPRDTRARELESALRHGGPKHWAEAASSAEIPFE